MELADLGMMGVFAMLLGLMVVEFVRPARTFEHVKWWRLKGFFFVMLMFAVGGVLPLVLLPMLPDVKLLPGDRLGVVGGTLFGILAFELITYWLHRAHHRLGFLWRWVHQMHHSAERMDVFGSGYFHPFEMIESAIVGVVIGGMVLGLTPQAAALVGVWQAFNGIWQHANVKTPAWLGYFIQRPEQHGVHHERGVHAFNYANLPLWDLVFGTFRNPETWEAPAGFFLGASKKVLPMLIGRDVSNDQPGRTREAETAREVQTAT